MIRATPGSVQTATLTDSFGALTLSLLTAEIRDNGVLVLSVPNSAISLDEGYEAVFITPSTSLGRMSFVWQQSGVDLAGASETLLIGATDEDPGYTVGVPAETDLQNLASGHTLTAQLLDNGGVVQSILSADISFDESYVASWTPTIAGRFTFAWFEGATTEIGSEVITVEAVGATTYTTPALLRDALNTTDTILPDAAANEIILDAEDAIDGMLGAWPWVNEITGRKIDESFVMPWQWAKLGRATTKMAVALYRRPDLLSAQRYDRIKGPDFEREGLRGSSIGSQITSLLDDSRLRRLTGRATQGPWAMRPDFQRFLTATRHDGT